DGIRFFRVTGVQTCALPIYIVLYKLRGLFNMKNNFWHELPRPFFVLAPMEDVTDVVFRHVVSAAGRPDVFFTEFTNTESYCHPDGQQSVRGRLTRSEERRVGK